LAATCAGDAGCLMPITAVIVRLAWRNLWRNHRRTLIMIAAVAVGVSAMLFMTALLRGMVNEMIRGAVKTLPGHIQIHHPDYRDDPNVVNAIAQPQGELLETLQSDAVISWASRVRVPAVISSERESRSLTLLGVNPVREGTLSFVMDNMVAGRFLDRPDDAGIVIGRKLAERLETGVGKRIVLMSQDPDNEIVDRGFRIVGLFEAKLQSIEEGFVFIGMDTAQTLLRLGDRVHEVSLAGSDFRRLEPLYQAVAAAAGPELSVLPWYRLDSYLGALLELMDGFVLVWIIVIFLALAFGLVNTLVMAVFERVHEIGLLLALGMRPFLILAQIVTESGLLLLIGLVIGNLLAWASVAGSQGGIDVSVVADGMEMFGASATLYPELMPADLLMANAVVFLLGLVASLSPAWRASRYQPIEALSRV
jgi:ABC-type lipoprotein release transport system permease subunit